MRLGALLGPIDAANPDAVPNLASQLEAEGYTSLWTVHAVGRGFMMPDPFIALSAAAVATGRVEIGTAILQLPLYHALDVAVKAFSLMQICGSRFILGVGAGSTETDFTAHGVDFADRFRRFDDNLATLRSLFADGSHGDTNLAPWPAVKGGPPIFYGTWTIGVHRAAGEFDGWIASALHRTPEQLEAAIGAYRDAGGKRAVVTTIQLSRSSDVGELKERFARYAEMGFDDAVVMFLPGAPSPERVRRLV